MKYFLLLLVILSTLFIFQRVKNKENILPNIINSPASLGTPKESVGEDVTVIAKNLDTPWALAFLPNKNILVTERPGKVNEINITSGEKEFFVTLPQVKEIGEGGLLGLALDPDFPKNNFIYLYYTYSGDESKTFNRVVRMIYKDRKLTDEKIIVDKIPGAPNHNGGRIKFGPDKNLYITTGDAGNPSQAQDLGSLSGKILRVINGNAEIYSYGHRNPQGITWDSGGNLWATEHGRSGVSSGLDELNSIGQGKNYGWPDIEGDETKSGMETPVINSGTKTTWAPSGISYFNGSLFWGGLRGQTLYEGIINGNKITLKEHYKNEFGRIRDVVLGLDNMLYITTSNQDGRGTPKEGDDKIIRVNLSSL